MRKTFLPAVAAGIVLSLAAPAGAARIDLTDAERDVMTATQDSSGTTTYNREGGAEGDIVFSRIQHTATQVVVYLRFRQLSVPRQYGGFDYILEGNNDEGREIAINTRHGQPQGTVEIIDQEGEEVRCASSHHINYAGDSISMRINRGCLKRPKYVRMRNVSYHMRVNPSTVRIYYDDPNRNGGTITQVQKTKTPWVVTG